MKLLKTVGTSLVRPICAFFGKCSFGRLKSFLKSLKSCHKAKKVYVMMSRIESIQKYSSCDP